MRRILGICEIVAAVVVLCLAILLSSDVSLLYKRSDAQQLGVTLNECSNSTQKLAKDYEQFHKEVLPQIKASATASRRFISSLKNPCDLLYSITCWNINIPRIYREYPFRRFQKPVHNFKEEAIPAYCTALKKTEETIGKFQGGSSQNICTTMPKVSKSLEKLSTIVQAHQDLNRRIAIYIIILGAVCSLLLLLSGIYYLRTSKADGAKQTA